MNVKKDTFKITEIVLKAFNLFILIIHFYTKRREQCRDPWAFEFFFGHSVRGPVKYSNVLIWPFATFAILTVR